MEKVIGGLSALGVLAGVWGVLALVAFLAGALPEGATAEVAEALEPVMTDVDAGPPALDAGPEPVPETDAGVDSGSVVAEPTERSDRWLRRYTACPNGLEVSLTAAQAIGDPKPELFVTCGSSLSVLVIQNGEDGPEPIRVATLSPTNGADELTLGRPMAADVTGDSIPDLVLPYSPSLEGARAAGAGLYLLPGSAAFGFERPIEIATLGTSTIRTAAFDAESGIDFVALAHPNAAAPRPLEAWVFAGGVSPVRTALLRGGRLRNTVAVLDMDGDEHLDLVFVSADEPRIDFYFGDGGGRFPRTGSLAIPGVTNIVVGDLNADGKDDLLTIGEEFALITPGAVDTLSPRSLGSVFQGSGGSSHQRVMDMDRDGDRDLTAIENGRLYWFEQTAGDELVFERHAWITASDPIIDYALFDFDSDGTLDAAVLMAGSSERAAGWAFVPGGSEISVPPGESHMPEDAPLVLRIPRD